MMKEIVHGWFEPTFAIKKALVTVEHEMTSTQVKLQFLKSVTQFLSYHFEAKSVFDCTKIQLYISP